MKRLTILAIATIAIGPSLAAAPRGQPVNYSGSQDYQAYCTSCHGTGGKGDGIIAKSLSRKPADLTQLSKRNNGVFPEERAFRAIEGHTPGVHGDADMPVWADVFAKSSDSLGADAAKLRISVLVKYLETLQEKK